MTAPGAAPVRLFAGLAALAAAERARWPLWLPVMLGAGCALYFALAAEPPPPAGPVAGLGAFLAALAAIRFARARIVLALAGALALGFAVAMARTAWVAAPILDREIVAHVTGRVLSVEPARAGLRLTLGDLRSGRFSAQAVPRRARIAVQRGAEDFHPGDGIALTARLAPPRGPAMPGDSDLGRTAFFAGIGAVGFAFGVPHPAPLARQPDAWERLAARIETLRETMTLRLRDGRPGASGEIAGALVTGLRGGIAPDDDAALRDAGLAHVLAISGLNMALVGMGLFWLARAVLAAFPVLALQYPIKKWAAGAALAGAAFYLVISGASASATRAFVMLAMMLVAILFDRPALSIRNLGMAAGLLLLARPESIVEPGFQMSFAAVGGLILAAEWEEQRRRRTGAPPRGMLLRYVQGVAMTSLVGSLATLPFAIFYFGRVTHYAVLGNLLAMPVMGLAVMPAACLSVLAMPFGLEHWPVRMLGASIDVMLAVGRFVSGLPGAVTLLPAFPVGALVLVSLGGAWLAIWRRRWRWWGVAPMLLGLAAALAAPAPDLLVGRDARTIALRGRDGLLHFVQRPQDRYAAARWLLRDGDGRDLKDATGPQGDGDGVRCDGWGCVAHRRYGLVALPRKAEALAEDCARAVLVLSAVPAPDCKGPLLVLDSQTLRRGGGYAIMPDGTARSVQAARGVRPWSPVQ